MTLNASHQLKVVGALVIGLSALLLFGAAVGLAVDQEKLIDALLVCMPLWGLATGIGLLRLRPWARLKSGLLQFSLPFPQLCQSLTSFAFPPRLAGVSLPIVLWIWR
jgi:hypothetical protein